jgi:hypothetical protein
VLAVVAARLRLFDLARRAYGEALDLDAGIGDAQRDVGVVRLERRRWARALEGLADEAALGTAAAPGFGRPAEARPPLSRLRGPRAARRRSGRTSEPPAVARPSEPVLDPSEESAAALRQAVPAGPTARWSRPC